MMQLGNIDLNILPCLQSSKSRLRFFLIILATSATFIFYIFWNPRNILEDAAEYKKISEIVNENLVNWEKFIDVNFNPLLNVYKHGPTFKRKTNFRSSKIPIIFIASHYTNQEKLWKVQALHLRKNACPLQCRFTIKEKDINKADVIGFYESDNNICQIIDSQQRILKGNRDLRQPWVYFALEPPTRAHFLHKKCKDSLDSFFNRTVSYRRDADIRVYHGFVVAKNESRYLPRDWVLSLPNAPATANRKLAAIFLSRCNTPSGRSSYIEEMKKYTNEVFIYGKCGDKKCGFARTNLVEYSIKEDQCYKMISSKYMFYLSFENSICANYATEKVYNIMYYPVVPVVLGGADYKSLLPPHSFINAANFSPEELVKYLLHLQSHPEEYARYFEWKKYFQPSTIESERSLCDLCVQMHNLEFYKHKVYTNFTKWFIDESKCNRSWSISGGIQEIDSNEFYNSVTSNTRNPAIFYAVYYLVLISIYYNIC